MNTGYRFPRRLTRRRLLKEGVRAGLCAPYLLSSPLSLAAGWRQANPTAPNQGTGNSPFYQVDEAFLEDLESAHFRFFWEQMNPDTGVVRDRCNAITPDKSDLGSIASLGFGLTALCIGDKRGYVPHNEARGRAVNALRFMWKKAAKPPRILLSLGECKYGRKAVGFRGFVNRHGNFTVRSADLRSVFRAFGNFRAGFDDL